MRLWMIPWISLTSILILIIGIQWVYYHSNTFNTPNKKTASIKSISSIVNETENGNGTGTGMNNIDSIRKFYKEAVSNGVGEWICNTDGEVDFRFKPSTESIISSQVQAKVNIKLKGLQENYKTNAMEMLENKKKETITECQKAFQIEAVSKGVGKWETDNNGIVDFRWKKVPEIVMEYTCTESNKDINVGLVKRELPFTYDNYRVARNVGIDIEGELIKRVSLSIEGVFWGKGDNELKEKVRGEVVKSIHGMFDGFESLNKIDKRYNIK